MGQHFVVCLQYQGGVRNSINYNLAPNPLPVTSETCTRIQLNMIHFTLERSVFPKLSRPLNHSPFCVASVKIDFCVTSKFSTLLLNQTS